jgi:hypothetical protein
VNNRVRGSLPFLPISDNSICTPLPTTGNTRTYRLNEQPRLCSTIILFSHDPAEAIHSDRSRSGYNVPYDPPPVSSIGRRHEQYISPSSKPCRPTGENKSDPIFSSTGSYPLYVLTVEPSDSPGRDRGRKTVYKIDHQCGQTSAERGDHRLRLRGQTRIFSVIERDSNLVSTLRVCVSG